MKSQAGLLGSNGRASTVRLSALVLLTLRVGLVLAEVPIRTVVLSGDHAPGTPDGVVYTEFGNSPHINDAGQLGFIGYLHGPGVTSLNAHGFWVAQAGQSQLILRGGDPIDGAQPGEYFLGGAPSPGMTNSGRAAFWGGFDGPSVTNENQRAIWQYGASGVTLVARGGQQAPNLPDGVVYGFPFQPAHNGGGHTAFVSNLVGGDVVYPRNHQGLFAGTQGDVRLLARVGDHAPGFAGDIYFAGFGLDVSVNEKHETTFGAVVGQGEFFKYARATVWTSDASGLHVVAAPGQQAPGLPNGETFSGVADP